MLEWIMGLYQGVLDNTKDFPQAQAALITTSSVAAAGLVGFLLMKLPRVISNFFYSQCQTSLVFNTASTSWSQYNQMQYLAFLRWFAKNKWFGWSRVITLDGEAWKEQGAVGPGVGTHFFIYKRRFFLFRIAELDSQGTSTSKYKISISVIGRNKQPIYDLMDEFMDKGDNENQIAVYTSSKDEWSWLTRLKKRDEKTMIISESVQRELIDRVREFADSKKWYEERGLDYKLCILLYGPPGTGKSSLARLVASILNRDLYLMNPDGSANYMSLFQRAKGGVVLMEDIDAFGITGKRTEVETDVETGRSKVLPEGEGVLLESNEDKLQTALNEMMGGSLSGLLNGLQGVIGLDDTIILMSTNHPEKLDPALIRDSRVDFRVEVGYMNHDDITRYHDMCYKVPVDESVVFEPLPAATVYKNFLMNKHDAEGFVSDILTDGAKFN